ncbi:DNA-binding IclR family transcriptional regulator [Crossiella equi]|uniref:DNA-binding IclR family transcriptional regulator n=1 Tax=Crossiella equi TaxID=130796 RepID=A0ABS5A966_9PSEU|nr:IclR family transcriptional regulator [Crossiella equi]MBP2473105.1 DNA-binding IclR family transcriptional regulator [Crossiella equi]
MDSPPHSVTLRALALLGTFDAATPSQTLSELSRRTGLPLATTHRLLADLTAWGALTKGADGRYRIGLRLWQLGILTPAVSGLREVALPFMQDLYETTRENIHLGVRDGDAVLYVDRLSGHRSVAIVSQAGSRLPLHATGVGKALLAHEDPEFVRRFCAAGPQRCTQYTIVEPGRLLRELTEVRRRGYALTSEEMTLGACSVAVPVRDGEGRVVAALGMVLHTVRADLAKQAPGLQAAAAGIERRLRGG